MNVLLTILTLGLLYYPSHASLDTIKKCATDSQTLWVYLRPISYEYDDEGFWKSPQQVIKDQGGDCEDYATLVYEVLKGNGYDVQLYLLGNKGTVEHCVCYFKKGNDVGIFSNNALYLMDIEKYAKSEKYDFYRVASNPFENEIEFIK
jgi:hypothetical protein